MSTTQSLPEQETPAGRTGRTLPAGVAFTGSAITFISLYLTAGAPTPLLALYQKQWDFTAPTLTLAFAVYAGGFLAASLTVGSLSDHLGRRPVLLGALVVQLVSVSIFLTASDIGWIIAARGVQGIATGAATSAFTAALVELAPAHRKKLATIISSVGVTGGLAAGALLAGLAIEFIPQPNSLVFIILGIITLLGIGSIAASPESGSRRSGTLGSLVPRVVVPTSARAEFMSAAPGVAAAWMLAGLSLGLAPTLVQGVFEIDSGLLNGITSFIGPATSAAAGLAFIRVGARRGVIIGIIACLLGTAGILAGVLTGSIILMMAGQFIGGIGFGAAFTGALRLIIPLTAPHQRSASVAALYVVSYLAFSIPVVLVGLLAAPLGLVQVITAYAAATAVLGLISIFTQLFMRGKDPRSAT
jgi:MFS family permease